MKYERFCGKALICYIKKIRKQDRHTTIVRRKQEQNTEKELDLI